MIITGIPFDEKLNIGVLSKVFERKRISNCYKYFWFQAILENIVEDKVVFTYDEILNQVQHLQIIANGTQSWFQQYTARRQKKLLLNLMNYGIQTMH